MKQVIAAFLLILLLQENGFSQVPIGEWQLHLSYDKIIDITFSANNVYAATEAGIEIFDRTDKSLSSLNKLSGLTGAGITAIAYDAQSDQIVIAYDDSNIDMLTTAGIVNYSTLRDLSTITGSRRLNDISIRQAIAFLPADYGVVVLDLNAREVKETWRDLGPSGADIKIFDSAIYGDSIALATEDGVMIGNLDDNLLDFNFWKRYNTGDFSSGVQFVKWFDGALYVAVAGKGLYRKDNGAFTLISSFTSNEFSSLESSNAALVIAKPDGVVLYNSAGDFIDASTAEAPAPLIAKIDATGILWIGDETQGLVSDLGTGNFLSYKPNGPMVSSNAAIRFTNNNIYALAGGFSLNGNALGNDGTYDVFNAGTWSSLTTPVKDLTDVTGLFNGLYLASFDGGLVSLKNNETATYDETNSPLMINSATSTVSITSLYPTDNGLWLTNYNTATPLHFLSADNSWASFSPSVIQSKYLTKIVIDDFNNVWGIINPANGGGLLVFNPETNDARRLTTLAGNGALPDNSVLSIAKDRDGYIWIGTEKGVAYFYSADEDAVRPIFENRHLLKDEKINAIAVDGGNRKWMGTDRGVWLFTPNGEALVHNFNTDNSPLLSGVINDIAIDGNSGEVFFATAQGIASYRGDATIGEEQFETLKIFPNPVTANFHGSVGISGLVTDAIVKITDISGKLLWEGKANGGTASWDVRDYNGRRASTGIYLVFATTADGADRAVGKIVIID